MAGEHMSLICDCRYLIKGKPAELAEFTKNHIRHGHFNLESLGIDYPEYFNTENPYNPRKIMKYEIKELNIWLTIVRRRNFERQFVYEDIFNAIRQRYPHLEVQYGYIEEDTFGIFHFPGGTIRCDEDNLDNFKVDYEFKPIEDFNKIVLEGNHDDLAKFLENEVVYGKLKSHRWTGNNIREFENRIAIYFEGITRLHTRKTYDYISSKYPQLHIALHTLTIRHAKFTILEDGRTVTAISLTDYMHCRRIMRRYNFFEGVFDPVGYFVENAFNTLVLKACERYRYENRIYQELSLNMYYDKADSQLELYYC